MKVLNQKPSIEAGRLGYSPHAKQKLIDSNLEIVLVKVSFGAVDLGKRMAAIG